MSFLFVIYDFIDEYHSSPQINWYWSETCVIIVNSYTSGQKCFPTNRYFRSGWVIRPITFSPVARQLLVFGTYDIRDLWWNLTESIWKRRLSCGLICIRFWNLKNSNQSLILNFSSKNWSRASFKRFDKLQLFAVFGIWQIRSDFGSKFVKSSKRRTKISSRESFWFVVFRIWQNSSQNRSESVKFQKRRTIEVCQIAKTKHVINFSKRNLKLEIGSNLSNSKNECISGHMTIASFKWILSNSKVHPALQVVGPPTNIVEPCLWCTPKFLEPF